MRWRDMNIETSWDSREKPRLWKHRDCSPQGIECFPSSLSSFRRNKICSDCIVNGTYIPFVAVMKNIKWLSWSSSWRSGGGSILSDKYLTCTSSSEECHAVKKRDAWVNSSVVSTSIKAMTIYSYQFGVNFDQPHPWITYRFNRCYPMTRAAPRLS